MRQRSSDRSDGRQPRAPGQRPRRRRAGREGGRLPRCSHRPRPGGHCPGASGGPWLGFAPAAPGNARGLVHTACGDGPASPRASAPSPCLSLSVRHASTVTHVAASRAGAGAQSSVSAVSLTSDRQGLLNRQILLCLDSFSSRFRCPEMTFCCSALWTNGVIKNNLFPKCY